MSKMEWVEIIADIAKCKTLTKDKKIIDTLSECSTFIIERTVSEKSKKVVEYKSNKAIKKKLDNIKMLQDFSYAMQTNLIAVSLEVEKNYGNNKNEHYANIYKKIIKSIKIIIEDSVNMLTLSSSTVEDYKVMANDVEELKTLLMGESLSMREANNMYKKAVNTYQKRNEFTDDECKLQILNSEKITPKERAELIKLWTK